MKMLRRTPATLVAVLGLVMAACGGATAQDQQTPGATTETGGGLTVVATTSILGDVVAQLVGDDGTVEVLMGPGVDPHAFQASAQQAQLVREADLVVANGLRLEESLLDTLEAAEADGVTVMRIAEELDPIPYEHDGGHGHEDDSEHADEVENEHAHEDDSEHAHDHGAHDPHVWFDPLRMARGVELVAAELAEVDASLEDGTWQRRGQQYADTLTSLDAEVEQTLAEVPEDDRKLVTNHDAFGYFADRYDFEVIGTVIPGASTQADPSAAEFARLAEVIVDEGVPAIFTESTSSDHLAGALAEEVGRDVAIVELYSGSLGEEGSGVETYVDLLRHDARAIASALS